MEEVAGKRKKLPRLNICFLGQRRRTFLIRAAFFSNYPILDDHISLERIAILNPYFFFEVQPAVLNSEKL